MRRRAKAKGAGVCGNQSSEESLPPMHIPSDMQQSASLPRLLLPRGHVASQECLPPLGLPSHMQLSALLPQLTLPAMVPTAPPTRSPAPILPQLVPPSPPPLCAPLPVALPPTTAPPAHLLPPPLPPLPTSDVTTLPLVAGRASPVRRRRMSFLEDATCIVSQSAPVTPRSLVSPNVPVAPPPSPAPQDLELTQPLTIAAPPGLVHPCLPSVGSEQHGTGRCRPCGWFWKAGGCANGQECCHCHLCPRDEIKMRRKTKMALKQHLLPSGAKQPNSKERVRAKEQGREVAPYMTSVTKAHSLPRLLGRFEEPTSKKSSVEQTLPEMCMPV